MKQKRVATIQDISCFGKCSLTVALPIISAIGVETAIIPTAVLSTHTGGFSGFTFRDLTEDIDKIREHWKSIDLDFDVIYTGYLGSFEQIEKVREFLKAFKNDNNISLIDPAMGDNGRLYTGFTPEFALEMGKLCSVADVIVPNLTEAAFMLGEEFVGEDYDKEYILSLLKRLSGLGAKNIILTGISYEKGKIGAVTYSAGTEEYNEYFTDKIGDSFHGTGDIFASVCAGFLARGLSIEESSRLACDYVVLSIKATLGDDAHWYGVRFEDELSFLTDMSKKISS